MAEKAHAAGKRTGGVGFLRIWLFCQIIRSFRNQPVKVALIGPILQYPELFKLFLSKGFGDGGGHREAVKRENNNVYDFLDSDGYVRLKADMSASSKELCMRRTRFTAPKIICLP